MRITLLCCLLTLSFATPTSALTVAAASSLRLAISSLTEAFEQQHPDTPVTVIFGASGKLATQIVNGAPYDVFLSADTAYPQQLVHLDAASPEPLVYAFGRLVIWHADRQREALTPEDLGGDAIQRIAIAQPRHAPYGQRAREALQSLGLWQDMQPKLVYGENIGQTAAMVESGAADAGLIAWSLTYSPELAGRPFTLLPRDLHSPLAMAMVITNHGAEDPASQRFRDFMQSARAGAILRQYGFETPDRD
jgi:molybdate transport system substrate-binding protein